MSRYSVPFGIIISLWLVLSGCAAPAPEPEIVPTMTFEPVLPTQVEVYLPQEPGEIFYQGVCREPSHAVFNLQAWRCAVDSDILDPCFAITGGDMVVCEPDPVNKIPGIWVQLDTPLPDIPVDDGEQDPQPWLVELSDGSVCTVITDTMSLVQGRPVTYLCDNGFQERTVILGSLIPGVTWQADVATLILQGDDYSVRDSRLDTLRSVWQFSGVEPPTEIVHYVPEEPPAGAQPGVCLANSARAPSLAAWQCEVGGEVFDPCFELPDGSGVVCGSDPAKGDPGFGLSLTQPLPDPDSSITVVRDTPWVLTLAGGTICHQVTPTMGVVDGKRISYACSNSDQAFILGDLQPGTVWLAELAQLTTGADGFSVVSSEIVEVRSAWQFSAPQDVAAEWGLWETTIVNYTPALPGGEPRTGSCWTNSLAVPSRLAWRCDVDNQLFDPCFEVPGEPWQVVCGVDPLEKAEGFAVALTEPLPPVDIAVDRAAEAWLLRLLDGTVCSLSTGATGTVDGKPIAYLCESAESDREVVVLDVIPGKVWVAQKAILDFSGEQMTVASLEMSPVESVARGPVAFEPVACDGIAESLGDVLGVDTTVAEAPFQDYGPGDGSGEQGIGCAIQAVISGTIATDAAAVVDTVRNVLILQGWSEDMDYSMVDASSNAAGFRNGGALCLLNIRPVALDRGLGADSPPTHYSLNLNCARDMFSEEVVLPPSPNLPERVEFQRGGTAASLMRNIAAGEAQPFILRAMAGQLMMVEIVSPGEDVYLAIEGADDGMSLLSASENLTYWSGKLPATQDYLLKAVSRNTTTFFTLNTIIPRTLHFEEGEREIAVEGVVAEGATTHYLLPGQAGQVVTVSLQSDQPGIYLSLYGLDDGQPLIRSAAESAVWYGTLPSSQDYIVHAVSTGDRITYTLQIDFD